jgi:hypothetical protein
MPFPKDLARGLYNFSGGVFGILLLSGFAYLSYDMVISNHPTDLSTQDINDNLRRLTFNCADGGLNPKGISYSVFPDGYDSWYEVNISDSEIECMRSKKILIISENTIHECDSKDPCGRGVIAKPPEWFKPKSGYASIKTKTGSDATVWKPISEKYGSYFISRH